MGRLRALALAVLVACTGTSPPPAPAPERLAESSAEPPLEVVEVVRGVGDDTVVVLHGYGATPEGIVHVLDGWPGPGRLLAPRAPTSAGRGWSWFALSSEAGGFDALAPGITAAADRVAAFIRGEVGRPVVVTGFSQGGMLSFALAVRHPELVTLAVPLSGTLPASMVPRDGPPASAPPIRALHGSADSRIPVDLARRTVDTLRERGWDAELQTWDQVDHTVTPQMRATLVRHVEGALDR